MIASPLRDQRSQAAQAGGEAPLRPFGRDDFDRNVWSALGMPVDLATAPEAVAAIEQAIRDRTRLSFVTPNVNFLVRAAADEDARRQILDADLSLVDGAPLVLIGRLLGVPIKERCAGSDVFEALRRRPGFPGRRIRVFFFGGRDGAAAAAAAALEKDARGLESAGFFDPGVGDVASMSTNAIIDRINAANADFVIVALGAAKGQAWITQNADRLTAPVVSHLGAVVDFTAGTIRRAPAMVSRLGFEWLWRIKEEPSLWRRYWQDGAALLGLAATRLAPAMATRRGSRAAGPARARLGDRRDIVVVELSGDLTADSLEEVRRAFREAAARGRDVALDIGAAGRIDAAFIGLVLMLEKNLRAAGAAVLFADATRAQRRLFAAHGLDYGNVSLPKAADVGIAAAV
jgi:N-acetylglucosaminyldiphosphoundecaprenol N-acetyl-beta-D-mannosaminyltransferase